MYFQLQIIKKNTYARFSLSYKHQTDTLTLASMHSHTLSSLQPIPTLLCKVHYLYFTLFLHVKVTLLQYLNCTIIFCREAHPILTTVYIVHVDSSRRTVSFLSTCSKTHPLSNPWITLILPDCFFARETEGGGIRGERWRRN